MAQVITSDEAARLIRDGDHVAVSSFTAISMAEDVFVSIGERYEKEQHPKNISIYHVSGVGDYKPGGRGLNHLAHEGLIGRIYGAHAAPYPDLSPMMADGRIETYMVPQGVCCHIMRAMAGGEDGLLTKVGLNTFADPRLDGCKINQSCKEDVVELVNVCGKELLYYKAFPIDICLLKATYADEDGNISCENEPLILEQLEVAGATHRWGGKVVVQVHKIVKRGSLHPRKIKIPSVLVDYIVVGRKENTYQTHFFEDEKPELTGDLKVPAEAIEAMPFGLRKIAARRGALEIKPGTFVNIGGGMSEGVANVASEEGLADKILLGVESGLIGGVPVVGAIGTAYNPEVVIRQPECFDLYNGGLLDITFLGSAQIDREGNVNVTKFNGKVIGPGGFVNITQNTKSIRFIGSFTGGKTEIESGDGKLKVVSDGKFLKFVDHVEQVSFSGKQGVANGQDVLYITERAVFRLVEGGIMLIEIAPGVDLEKDILSKMEFRPMIADDLKLMDERIFIDQKMDLQFD